MVVKKIFWTVKNIILVLVIFIFAVTIIGFFNEAKAPKQKTFKVVSVYLVGAFFVLGVLSYSEKDILNSESVVSIWLLLTFMCIYLKTKLGLPLVLIALPSFFLSISFLGRLVKILIDP